VSNPGAEKFVIWAKALNDGQETFYQALKESDVTSVDNAVKALETAPSLDPKADELKERLKALLIKAKALHNAPDNSAKTVRTAQQEQHELTTEFDSWRKEYNVWLKTTGRSYGLVQVSATEPPK
jgi:hypothetical protein